MLYILYYSVVLILAFIANQDKVKSGRKEGFIFFQILVAVLLSIPIAFLDTGTDKERYLYGYYQSITSFSEAISMDSIRGFSWEYGFSFLCYIGHLLNLSPKVFLLTVSFLTNILFVRVFYKYPLPFFAILCFIVSSTYTQENNLIRQTLASAVFLYGLVELNKGKFIQYLCLIAVASLFHKSAIYLSFLALIPAFKLTEKKSFFYSCFILWGLSLLVFFKIIHVDFLNVLLMFSDASYEMYITGENTMGIAEVGIVEFLSMNLLLLLSLPTRSNKDVIFFVMVLAICGVNIRDSLPNLGRFFNYFSVVIPIYIVSSMKSAIDSPIPDKSKIFSWVVGFYIIVYQFIFITVRGGHVFFE